jgi:truncated hemoglobin YjbI
MRHVRFTIGPTERDAWYRAMAASVVEAELAIDLERRLLEYFSMAADHLINAQQAHALDE